MGTFDPKSTSPIPKAVDLSSDRGCSAALVSRQPGVVADLAEKEVRVEGVRQHNIRLMGPPPLPALPGNALFPDNLWVRHWRASPSRYRVAAWTRSSTLGMIAVGQL